MKTSPDLDPKPVVDRLSPSMKEFMKLVTDMNLQWKMFDDIYGKDENYPVLNGVGTQFWNYLQDKMLDMLFLSISRFFDPVGGGANVNLSLKCIITLPEVADIQAELIKREVKMRANWEKGIKIWRHKRISHSDKAFALKEVIIPEVKFTDMKKLVDDITEFADFVHIKINIYQMDYTPGASDWIPSLFHVIKMGLDAHEEEMKKYE